MGSQPADGEILLIGPGSPYSRLAATLRPEFCLPLATDGQSQALADVRSDSVEASRFEAAYRRRIAAGRDVASALNDLGAVLQMQGLHAAAVESYRAALGIDPDLRVARRNLATMIVHDASESARLWRQELAASDEGLQRLQERVAEALNADLLDEASLYASTLAGIRYASPWFPSRLDGESVLEPICLPARSLTLPKLKHDVKQFRYLAAQGVLRREIEAILEGYRRVHRALPSGGLNQRFEWSHERDRPINEAFGRICYLRETPRVDEALSDRWESSRVESSFAASAAGVVVIDDFLTPRALHELRQFCLESTVWLANRYAYGRLGAFFNDGFNCPLLLQIASEIRERLPSIVMSHPVRQIWGFRNTEDLPEDATTHADFAAINVNFWITPTEGNLEPDTGGLVVYGADAPSTWGFAVYNGRSDIIRPFLREGQFQRWYIPYRENRAVIFNSDLFHGTAKVRFESGYERLRTNVTILYGDREADHERRDLSMSRLAGSPGQRTDSWRSPALARHRRG